MKKSFRFVLYFIITIVFFSSIGVWLPFAQDYAQYDCIKEETIAGLPVNLITYSIAIVMIAFIDRLLNLFRRTSSYHNNQIEFLLLVLCFLIGAILVYFSLTNQTFNRIDQAIQFSVAFTFYSWTFWCYVKVKDNSYDNYSSLGGEI